MTNEQVVDHWLAGEAASNGVLTTDGNFLDDVPGDVMLGVTILDGSKKMLDYANVSDEVTARGDMVNSRLTQGGAS